MPPRARPGKPSDGDLRRLLAYVADLELEVDRLRRNVHLLQHEVGAALGRIRPLTAADGAGEGNPLDEIGALVTHLAEVVHDLREGPGYHPAHDQVLAIAVRPLAEQVFRWHQHLLGAQDVTLQLDLESEHVEWFPARLRHILDSLLSNALKFRDPEKAGAWVRLALCTSAEAYELRVSDNGVGLTASERTQVFDLFYRAAPAQVDGSGVGLAVVKQLVEHSGGTLEVDAGAGQGATFVAVLPRYAVDDFLV
jgi:signal transduction histidine kinase